MPMRLNVGISRKVTDNNYGSRGGSINLKMELDSQLTSEPAKLHEKIRQLFGMARTALAEELNGQCSNGGAMTTALPVPATSGHAAAVSHGGPLRPATDGQIKALHAIARQCHVDLNQLLFNTFRLHRTEDLTVRQVSQAIDQLKSTGMAAGW